MQPPGDYLESGVVPPAPRGPRRMEDGALGEQQIQEAMRRGEFDNLAGRGRPIPPDRLQGGADAIFAGILKEANVVPEWVELARQLDGQAAAIRDRLAAAAAAFADARQQAVGLLEEQIGTGSEPPPLPRPRGLLGRLARRDRRQESPGEQLRDNLTRTRQARAAAFSDLLLAVYRFNAGVMRFNLVVPLAGRQRVRLVPDQLAAIFVAAWPALYLSAEAEGLALVEEAVEPPRPVPPSDTDAAVGGLTHEPDRVAAMVALRRGRRRPPPIG